MNRCIFRFLPTILLSIVMFWLAESTCLASDNFYVNDSTGYCVFIADSAELLTDAEEAELFQAMQPITTYGNVAFVSIDNNYTSASEYASDCYYSLFGSESGTLFLIDMDNRYLRIHSDGDIYEKIDRGYANTITDNVYRLASDEKYDQCAIKAFNQILSVLQGKRISQPMKYICNFLLALMLALSLNFAWMFYYSRIKRPKSHELLDGTHHHFSYGTAAFYHTHDTPNENNGGSGYHGGFRSGGSFRGGGGGFRGGRSGGGGGHRF